MRTRFCASRNLEGQTKEALLSEALLAATAAAFEDGKKNTQNGHNQEWPGEHHQHADEAGVGEVFAAAEQVEARSGRSGGDEHEDHEAEQAELEARAAWGWGGRRLRGGGHVNSRKRLGARLVPSSSNSLALPII